MTIYNVNNGSFNGVNESNENNLVAGPASEKTSLPDEPSRNYLDYYLDANIPWYERAIAGAALPLLPFALFAGCGTSTIVERKDECPDNDGDGYGTVSCGENDCDDGNRNISPDISEVCNGIDDNCDGTVDEEVMSTYYADSDGDGYGNLSSTQEDCEAPAGYVEDSSDCNDGDTSINPGAEEICNSVDDNCDGQINEGLSLNTYYEDADADNYGNPDRTLISCIEPDGYVTDNSDCDDTNAEVNPEMVIQDAVNAASDGDVVLICDGTYNEHVTINDKAITLLGESTNAIIDGSTNGTPVHVSGNSNVSLNDLTITGGQSGTGGLLTEAPVNVDGCIITGNEGAGITGVASTNYTLTVDNTDVSNNGGQAIALGTPLNVVIRNSTLTNNGYGILVLGQQEGGSVSIEDSTIDSNGIPALWTALGGGQSSSITISGGSISNNSYINGEVGDYASAIALTPWNGTLTITDGTLISGNESDHEGLFQMIGNVNFSAYMTIENATISDNVSANGDEIVHLETLDGDDFFESDAGAIWSGNSPNTIYFQGFGYYYYDIASFGASFVCSSTGCE